MHKDKVVHVLSLINGLMDYAILIILVEHG